jgi:DNA-binding NtrC family response regulator
LKDKIKVWVVDTPHMYSAIERTLRKAYETSSFDGPQQIKEALSRGEKPELLMLANYVQYEDRGGKSTIPHLVSQTAQIALITEVRAQGHEFPIIVMWSGPREELEASGLHHLSKPFDGDEIREVVLKALEKK